MQMHFPTITTPIQYFQTVILYFQAHHYRCSLMVVYHLRGQSLQFIYELY